MEEWIREDVAPAHEGSGRQYGESKVYHEVSEKALTLIPPSW